MKPTVISWCIAMIVFVSWAACGSEPDHISLYTGNVAVKITLPCGIVTPTSSQAQLDFGTKLDLKILLLSLVARGPNLKLSTTSFGAKDQLWDIQTANSGLGCSIQGTFVGEPGESNAIWASVGNNGSFTRSLKTRGDGFCGRQRIETLFPQRTTSLSGTITPTKAQVTFTAITVDSAKSPKQTVTYEIQFTGTWVEGSSPLSISYPSFLPVSGKTISTTSTSSSTSEPSTRISVSSTAPTRIKPTSLNPLSFPPFSTTQTATEGVSRTPSSSAFVSSASARASTASSTGISWTSTNPSITGFETTATSSPQTPVSSLLGVTTTGFFFFSNTTRTRTTSSSSSSSSSTFLSPLSVLTTLTNIPVPTKTISTTISKSSSWATSPLPLGTASTGIDLSSTIVHTTTSASSSIAVPSSGLEITSTGINSLKTTLSTTTSGFSSEAALPAPLSTAGVSSFITILRKTSQTSESGKETPLPSGIIFTGIGLSGTGITTTTSGSSSGTIFPSPLGIGPTGTNSLKTRVSKTKSRSSSSTLFTSSSLSVAIKTISLLSLAATTTASVSPPHFIPPFTSLNIVTVSVSFSNSAPFFRTVSAPGTRPYIPASSLGIILSSVYVSNTTRATPTPKPSTPNSAFLFPTASIFRTTSEEMGNSTSTAKPTHFPTTTISIGTGILTFTHVPSTSTPLLTPTPTSSSTPTSIPSEHHPDSGTISGITVGCIAGIAVIIAGSFWFWFRRRRRRITITYPELAYVYDPPQPVVLVSQPYRERDVGGRVASSGGWL